MSPLEVLKRFHFFIIIILFGLISLISVYSRYQDLAQKNKNLEESMSEVITENKALIERQYKLQNDAVFTESVAREKLKVAQEGEIIYKILPEE